MGNSNGKEENRVDALKIVKKESIPDNTAIYQLEDGTIFYYKWTTPQRLFMREKNRETDAILPDGNISIKGVCGNALYFLSQGQIYQATSITPGIITIALMRSKLSGENLFRGGVCSRYRNGNNYIYRIDQDPNRDGFQIKVSDEDLKWVTRTSHIHRDKVVFLQTVNAKAGHSVRKLSDNVIVAEAPVCAESYAPKDACPFVYFGYEDHIYVLDTETLNFLPRLRIEKIDSISSIAGVLDGVATLGVQFGSDCFIITTRLPVGYFKKTSKFYGIPDQKMQETEEAEIVLNNVLDRTSQIKKKKTLLEKQKNEISSTSPADIPRCVICLDNLPKIIFHECMHLIVCEECFDPTVTTSCPNCRKVIRSSAKVFF